MKKSYFSAIACAIMIFCNILHSQSPNDVTRQINRQLKVLSSPSPDVAGGYVFNNSYEGVKGGPLLFDKFVTVNIMVKEADFYIPVEANIDLRNNSLLYREPESGQLYFIQSDRIAEVITEHENDTLVFITSENKIFDPALNEIRFIQVLKAGANSLVKIPYKIFIPADYAGAYTAKRRYDEYRTEFRYFVMSPQNVYKEVNLTKKSLIRVFPENREIINSAFKTNKSTDKEKIVLSVLRNL